MNISYSAIKMHLVEIIFPPVDYVTSIFFDFFLNFLQFFLGNPGIIMRYDALSLSSYLNFSGMFTRGALCHMQMHRLYGSSLIHLVIYIKCSNFQYFGHTFSFQKSTYFFLMISL